MNQRILGANWKRAGLGAALMLTVLAASPARGDRIVFKDGRKPIEGIVKQIYPTTVEFIWEGRTISIPRSVIADIIMEGGGENIELLLSRARDSLTEGNPDQCEVLLADAQRLNGERGAYVREIQQLKTRLDEYRAAGTEADNRERALNYLAKVYDNFDMIELQQAEDNLLRALELAPALEELHDAMADYMVRNRPVAITLATDYFCDSVDPDRLKEDHPVIKRLPQIFQFLVTELKTASDPAVIDSNTRRLRKVSLAIESRPDWASTADTYQLLMIGKRAGGVIAEQIVADLDQRSFDRALNRLRAWEPNHAEPKVSQLYVRAWIGKEEMDQAKAVLASAKRSAPDEDWIDFTSNALDFYLQARNPQAADERAEAESALQTLFGWRRQLQATPELWRLVANSKVNFDLDRITAQIAAGDATGAADTAVRLHEYAQDGRILNRAEQTFREQSPNIAFKLNLAWDVGNIRIPLHEESSDIVREQLGRVFGIRFDNSSPFSLNVLIAHNGFKNRGAQIRAAVTGQTGDPWVINYLAADDADSMTGMRIEMLVDHEIEPGLYSSLLRDPPIPPGAVRGRVVDEFLKVYLDVALPADIDEFFRNDLTLYLTPEAMGLGSKLVLRR